MDFLRSQAIGLYLEQPHTWLHRIDPRIKIGWLLSFLISPILSNNYWRVGVLLLLVGVTFSTSLPPRVWKQQMGILFLLAAVTYGIAIFSGDALLLTPQPRRPTSAFVTFQSRTADACPLPQPTAYCYTLLKVGKFQITRRSQDLALRISTIIFTYTYSPTLFLMVTATEEITAALMALSKPLRWIGVPVAELTLTLTLSLRFIPLVLEEVQNLARAVRTRAINWRILGYRRSVQTVLILAEKLLTNLFTRSEQMAKAMQIRGFLSPDQARTAWFQLRLQPIDGLLGVGLALFWLARVLLGQD